MDLLPFLTEVSKLVGTLGIWELLRKTVPILLKGRLDSRAAKLAALRADINLINQKIEQCVSESIIYYTQTQDAPARSAQSQQIKTSIHFVGVRLNNVNMILRELNIEQCESHYIISFRKALTFNLDIANFALLRDDDVVVNGIYKAHSRLTTRLGQITYSLV